jgi:hypothetical protein
MIIVFVRFIFSYSHQVDTFDITIYGEPIMDQNREDYVCSLQYEIGQLRHCQAPPTVGDCTLFYSTRFCFSNHYAN